MAGDRYGRGWVYKEAGSERRLDIRVRADDARLRMLEVRVSAANRLAGCVKG